jgi:hypothetical protein
MQIMQGLPTSLPPACSGDVRHQRGRGPQQSAPPSNSAANSRLLLSCASCSPASTMCRRGSACGRSRAGGLCPSGYARRDCGLIKPADGARPAFALIFGFCGVSRVAIADVPPMRELKKRTATRWTMQLRLFWAARLGHRRGAAAALSGGATRGEKKRFSVSPKSSAAEASTKIRPLVIVGLVAGCADEAV